MILPNNLDAIHKAWLNRVLTAITDNAHLVTLLRFKGGTCAAMRGLIERFSVDLDFDLIEPEKNKEVQLEFEKIFKKLDLEIKDKSHINVTFPAPKSNDYEPVRLTEIDRIIWCQTVETMFANKLVAMMERHEKYGTIAGRDLFDLHTFFMKGYTFKKEIILERTGKTAEEYLPILKEFIQKYVTQTVIDQDLNTLLPPEQFKKIRGILKQEVMVFLE